MGWACEAKISEVQADQAGNFSISQLKPGRYCLDITSPQIKDANQTAMHGSFLIDVVVSAPRAMLIADISPRWPDCGGGHSL